MGAGEVHLQRCIDDLEKLFAGIKLNVSAPIVPFRETIVVPPTFDRVNEAIISETNSTQPKQIDTEGEESDKNVMEKDRGIIEIKTANKLCSVQVRALPLPDDVTQLLERKSDLIKILVTVSSATSLGERKQLVDQVKLPTRELLKGLYQELCTAFKEAGTIWDGAADDIWAFGPRRIGSNVLLNRIPGYKRPSMWQSSGLLGNTCSSPESSYREYDNSIVSGFQLATLAGPLCEEPMMGVCFVVEDWISLDPGSNTVATTGMRRGNNLGQEHVSKNEDCNVDGNINENEARKHEDKINEMSCEKNDDPKKFSTDSEDRSSKIPPSQRLDRFGPFSGQLMSAVKEGCRRVFLLQPVRLMAAMYTCDIQATAEVLGRMYAVLAKREGRVLREEMKEGSDVFDVTAVLPVAESFGFAEEIRKRTSGLANPQLVFSHWEVVDIDPFWVPTTEEEYTHFGEKADSENQARKYMNSVRRRKGLYVEEKTVEHAEKQRTLKK